MIIQPIIDVQDVEASITFYEKLGLKSSGNGMPGPDGKLVFGDITIGPTMLMLNKADNMGPVDPTAPRGAGVELHIGLDDDSDIDALFAKAKANGVTIVRELKEEFWGDKRFVFKDLDGYTVSFAKTVKQVSIEEMQATTRGERP